MCLILWNVTEYVTIVSSLKELVKVKFFVNQSLFNRALLIARACISDWICIAVAECVNVVRVTFSAVLG